MWKVVLVEWNDSSTYSGWTSVENKKVMANTPDGMLCRTVGYLIEETDSYFLVSHTLTYTPDEITLASDTIQIPKGAVTFSKIFTEEFLRLAE